MDVFTMVVLIVLISGAVGVAQRYMKIRKQGLDRSVDDGLQQDLDSMKERIEVLEKIVTDRQFRLADEISDLEGRA